MFVEPIVFARFIPPICSPFITRMKFLQAARFTAKPLMVKATKIELSATALSQTPPSLRCLINLEKPQDCVGLGQHPGRCLNVRFSDRGVNRHKEAFAEKYWDLLIHRVFAKHSVDSVAKLGPRCARIRNHGCRVVTRGS